MRAQRVVEAVEGAGGRRRVAAQDRVLGEGLRYLPRNCDVGEEHELFDHRVGLLEIVHRHICRVAGLRVEHEAHLWGDAGTRRSEHLHAEGRGSPSRAQKRTSGDARERAPLAARFALSAFASRLSVRSDSVRGSTRRASSIRS